MGSWAGKEVEAGKRKDGDSQTYFPTFGAPHSLRPPGFLPLPLLLLWKEQQSLRLQGGEVRRSPQPPTYTEALLLYRIYAALFPLR